MKQLLMMLIVSVMFLSSRAQDSTVVDDIEAVFVPEQAQSAWVKHNKEKVVMFGLYYFYKKCVSAYDVSTCKFSPSCSSYGMLSVRKRGVIIGIIDTFDRLTRCHANHVNQYHFDSHTGLFTDIP
jgi:putative component of membrane protein insertase Oxa1/YidC/SpoIIIJ protein YidD